MTSAALPDQDQADDGQCRAVAAHWIWLIMKLDSGHLITPVPWPIQSSPVGRAR